MSRILLAIIAFSIISACGEGGDKPEDNNSGTADNISAAGDQFLAVENVDLGEMTDEKINRGEEIFNQKCKTCHQIDNDLIGPSLKNVTERRSPEFIISMIMDPEAMAENNEKVKQMRQKYNIVMTYQDVNIEDAKNLYFYLKNQ
ncbi:MAG: c-type cytochrome [Candidatus Kapaibacterium sp.]